MRSRQDPQYKLLKSCHLNCNLFLAFLKLVRLSSLLATLHSLAKEVRVTCHRLAQPQARTWPGFVSRHPLSPPSPAAPLANSAKSLKRPPSQSGLSRGRPPG